MAQDDLRGSTWEEDSVMLHHDDVSDFNQDNILPLEAEKLAKVRAWLQPTVYEGEGSEFTKHSTAHLPGTGEWLLQSPTYQEWHEGKDKGLLWIRGIPGSGKSVFAATLINHLRQDRVPVLFFFFKQIIDANHQPIAAVHDWLVQVLPYSPPLQVKLMTYLTARQTLESLSIVQLWRDLLMALRDIPRAFIVVDALDEMDRGDEMQVFLQHIAELASWRPAHTKMLITSRPVAYIETALRRANAVNIRLVENAVDVDIAAYVSHHLATSAIKAEDQALIRAAVPGRANGLFIYAKLAMVAFLQPGADVRSVLDILPRDLNVMYNDLLRQHAARSGLPDTIQLLILQFVTHATRPLRLLEIASLINVSQYPPEKRDLKAMKELVRVACGPLLEVLPDETVSVIHHSLTEFLTGATRDIEDGGYPILDGGITHHQLSLACLGYLDMEYLGNANLKGENGTREDAIYDGLGRDTFARYAGANWFVHARKAALAGADQADLLPLLDDIFGSHKLAEIWSMSKGGTSFIQRWMDGEEGHTSQIRPVYIACTFGLNEYVKILLSRASVEANKGPRLYSESLLLAATKGDAEIVDALLKAGADPDERDRQPFSGKAPLHYAVEHNHPKVIKILLDGGADPMRLTHFNDPSSWGHRDPSAFEWACTKGHLAALQAFLPYIKSEKAISEAVSWVAPTGRADMLAAVLAHPLARVNDMTDCLTPLFLASGKRDAPMVRALLAAGADAKTLHASPGWGGCIDETGFGNTALHAWAAFDTRIETNAEYSHGMYKEYDAEATVEVFKLLVEAGADVKQRNSAHYTPLHYAQDAMAARLLVEAGADVDAVSRRGRTLVELSRDRATVQYLLEEGGASKHLEKAMSSMLFDRNQWYSRVKGDGNAVEMVQLLLDHGVDPNMADSKGQTPLHHLVNHGAGNSAMRIDLMKGFLRAGLDVNVRNAEGQRPLHLLSLKAEHEQNDAVFLDAMLDAGADIEAKDDLGRTPLFFRIDNSDRSFDQATMLSECKVMASKGARLDTRDSSGRTLLHAAIGRGTGAVIAWLLEHGVDPKLTDDDGNTLFHEMMKPDKMYRNEGTRTYSICQKLVGLGVDMQQANSAGRTPLHMTISEGVRGFVNQQPEDTGPATVLDWILGRSHDVDVADRYGITPLHLASTFSEGSAERLLEAGADPLKPTVEGLNCLHLAARARQVNILGIMLETVAARNSKGEALLPSTGTSGTTQHQRSPLFYACASGQPESVDILLKTGMAVHTGKYPNSALQAVVGFEEEAANWPSEPTQYQDDKRCVGSVTLEDRFRKAASPGPRPTARIEEILDMLVVKDELFIKEHIGEAIEEAMEKKAAYTLECLLRIKIRLGIESGTSNIDAIESLLQTRQKTRNSFEEKLATRGSFTDDEFIAAMTGRFFEIVAKSMSPENSLKLVKEDSHTITRLQYLALGGYAALLREVGHVESINLLEDAKWVEKVEKESYVHQSGIRSLLITACARSVPNMAVVKVLVERFGVGVNRSASSPRITYHYQGDESASALHALAIGARWWQLAEGIPYLVAHGADIDMRDGGGSSPLNTVLDRLKRCRWDFSKRAFQVLLNHGADVTSTDNQGVSCVQRAIHDPEIHRLALFHVPFISSHDLISATESKNSVAVETLLEAGADPNGRDVLEVNEFHNGSPMLLKTKSTEMFPLEVVMTIFRPYDDCSAQPKMIESLLKYGADILATYGESTLIHQLLAQHVGEPFRQLLEKGIPGLDPNCTDANGVTIFHMACRYLGKVKTSRNEAGEVVYGRTDDRPSPAAVLLSLGADVYARDKSGRNTLHHLASPIYGCIDVDMVRRIATMAPELTNERDETGKTPLHMAVDDEWLTGTNVVDALLNVGADPTIADSQGNNALHLLLGHKFHVDKPTSTVVSPRATIIDSLLAVPGMDLNAVNDEGETPLFAYIRRGGSACNNTKDHVHTPDNDEKWEGAMMDLLDARGANWRARNGVGKTLLHVTVEAKEWNLRKQNLKVPRVKYLLRKGVDPAAEDWHHRTALDYATSLGYEEVLNLFRHEA